VIAAPSAFMTKIYAINFGLVRRLFKELPKGDIAENATMPAALPALLFRGRQFTVVETRFLIALA
jgi:hypothetical protein